MFNLYIGIGLLATFQRSLDFKANSFHYKLGEYCSSHRILHVDGVRSNDVDYYTYGDVDDHILPHTYLDVHLTMAFLIGSFCP